MDLTEYRCPKCDAMKNYSNEYDSWFCESCNEWLEDICTDRDCEFCKRRPIKPNGVNES
jgi:lipopolysaccharide biosynthesis regulator YciM